MSKKGLPLGLAMRHGKHYIEELTQPSKTVGKMISIDLIVPNPEQPRIDVGNLSELSDSIAQKGVLEPLLVKRVVEEDSYMIIAGERRWRSAKLAGLKEVPCIELDIDEKEIAEIALIENMQRKDLTIWEEADGLLALQNKFHYTHADIAKKIGKSRTSVTEALNIASLSESVREKIKEAGNSSKQFILQVARQFDEESMFRFIDSYNNNGAAIKQKPKNPLASQLLKEQTETDKISQHPIFNFTPKLFSYNDESMGCNIKVKFKAATDKGKLIETLKDVISKLESH